MMKIYLNNNYLLVFNNITKLSNLPHRSLSTIQKDKQNSAQYCLELVRRYDYENFLSTLLMKGLERQSAFAIRAFNVEISKISSVVSDDKLGVMRLQFWNDAIEKMYASNNVHIPDHPVIKQLNIAVQKYKLPKIYLMRLIKSRARPSSLEFLTTNELEQYAEETVSSIYYLLLKLYKIQNLDADHAVSHLGKSQGIVNMLRSIIYLHRTRSIGVPQEILIKYGVSQERIFRNKADDKGVKDCIFDIAGIANTHLLKARNLTNKVPRDVRHLLLPAASVERYLERLRQVDFHLTNSQLLRRDAFLPFVYYWNSFRRKY